MVVVARAMAVRVGLRMARAWMVRVVGAVEVRVRAARAEEEVMVTRAAMAREVRVGAARARV